MANEDLVYAYETNFITALETILSVALTQTVAFGDTTVHKTPRIEAGFTYGGADQIDRALTSEGKQYLRKHNGTINLTVSGTEKDAHLVLVGKVRNFMAWNVPTLINPVLAFYQVQSVFEQAGSNEAGEEEGDFEISTELNFDVVFQIPPAAFNTITNIAITDGIDDFINIGDLSSAPGVTRILRMEGKCRKSVADFVYVQISDSFDSQFEIDTPELNTWIDCSFPFGAGTAISGATDVRIGMSEDAGEFTAADYNEFSLIGDNGVSTPEVIIAVYQLNEQSSGSLNGVTVVDSGGNGLDGIYDGCTGGTTPDL